MLSWFFKKRDDTGASVPMRRADKAAVPPSAPGAGPASPAGAAAAGEAKPDWAGRLQGAQGDDTALLAVAVAAPLLDVKMAAVAALATEAALRQAEREFRSHDRKVHRLAKQRLEAAVAQRAARAAAHGLLERAAAMLDDARLPINHLVELDRSWEALPAQALEPQQVERFAELRARLDAGIRERGEAQQRLQRWTADAGQALVDWQRGIVEVTERGAASEVAGLGQALVTLRAMRPEDPATGELATALEQALQVAATVEARLAWFDVGPAESADAAATPAPSWDELPAPADGGLARILEQRHEHWLRAQAPAVPAMAPPDPVVAVPPMRPAAADAPDAEQRRRIEALVPQAEQALAEGQLAAMQQHLQAIDEALGAASTGRLPAGLRARLQALRAEGARLKGWKQWGGARARDELAAEAEELARQTRAASDPDATGTLRLNLKSHAESIHALRQRWKELDHLGAVATQPLWQRFDAALQAAFEPVAAQHAVLKAARLENLSAREALLRQLDAVTLPPEALPGTPQAADWKPVLHELASFQAAWRKLGPIEHTAPAASRQQLQQRLHAAVDRIEAPLRALQRAAAAEREQLIVRVEALAPQASGDRPWSETGRRLRELQAEWQDHARRLPLSRAVEGGLWARFRDASDAVYAQRDAAAAARDAALIANLSAGEVLLERLHALRAETPPADIERTLAEVDRAWRQIGDLPRGAGEAIEARLRAARAEASGWLDVAARHRWQARCEALQAGLALCEAREDGVGDAIDAGAQEDAQGALPGAWAQALAQRRTRPVASGPLAATAVDVLLLELETGLGLPITPERQEERRQLKLRALKDAMEGRAPARQGAAPPAEGLLALLRQGGLSAAQRARLHGVVAALRQAPPGTLAVPMT